MTKRQKDYTTLAEVALLFLSLLVFIITPIIYFIWSMLHGTI